METASTDGNADSKVAFGKVLVGTSVITVEWIKEINNTAYSFRDTSLVVDEFDEFYITSTLALKSDNNTKDSFWIGKLILVEIYSGTTDTQFLLETLLS